MQNYTTNIGCHKVNYQQSTKSYHTEANLIIKILIEFYPSAQEACSVCLVAQFLAISINYISCNVQLLDFNN